MQSPTYKPKMVGIAFQNWVKCSNWYHHARDTVWKDGKATFPKIWLAPKQLDHEIGHTLGLRHTWRGFDGCDDTPKNPNCWTRTEEPPCDIVSNNVMDYNPLRNAWTPCQLSIIHYNFEHKEVKRKLLERKWCSLRAKPIVIKEKIEWNSCKDLEGHIIIEEGGTLTIRCRISLPKGARIEVQKGGKLLVDGGRIHNDCGDKWEGILVWKQGKEKGEVVFQNGGTVENVRNEIAFEEQTD